MSCEELVELITDYLDGALDAADRARFEAHLGECDGCTTYLSQMRRTIAVAGAVRADGIEPAAREELLHVFRAFRRGAV
jgi:anti-sigma factor RsiW